MKERGELLVCNLCCCCSTYKGVANSSVEDCEVLELPKEKTVPKEEKRFEEKCSKKFSHLKYGIQQLLGTTV